MEHEIRHYLALIKEAMHAEENPFIPTYFVSVVKLPNGAMELTINDKNIEDKIDYVLEAYDGDMCLKTNSDIVMQNIMVV